jgi:hypothetical protein
MAEVEVSRHGNRPAQLPPQWSLNQLAPGAVNMVFNFNDELIPLVRMPGLHWFASFDPTTNRLNQGP